jgi:hypothetical protein
MPDMTFEEALSQWWGEDADRINSMSEMAREFAVATPKEKKESRGFCPTGEGGGVDNSCGDGFSTTPNASELSKVSTLGGSTGATLSEDASGNRYVVKGGNSAEHIRGEAAANSIYRAAGVPVPRSRLDETDESSPKQVSEYVKAKPLASVTGDAREKAIAEICKGFAADALLANWDVVGLDQDNILVPDSGPPLRVDNGGALTFRAQGKPKPFGPTVGELDTLRTSEQGEPIFGGLTDQQVASQISELSSRRDKILASTPHGYRDVMSKRLDYMEKWASKKSGQQSRAFCPTGEGKGVDNSCGSGKKSPDDPEDIKPSAKAPEEPTDTVDSSSDSMFGTSTDAAATKTTVRSAIGEIEVIDRTDIHTRDYLDEIESDAADKGMVVDFKQAPALQSSTDLSDDDTAYRAFLGSAYAAFTGHESFGSDLSELDDYGPEYGLMTEYEAEQRVSELIDERWEDLDKDEWFGSDKPWSEMSPDEQAKQESEWRDDQYTEVYEEVEGEREEARSRAINDMRRSLESSLASATLDCCLQLYRGLRLSQTDVDKIIADGSITHPGPNSWTTSRGTSKGFGALGTLLVLRKPRVGHVHAANTGDEQEVTRPPSKLKLIGVVKTSSGNVLYLDEDDDYKDL